MNIGNGAESKGRRDAGAPGNSRIASRTVAGAAGPRRELVDRVSYDCARGAAGAMRGPGRTGGARGVTRPTRDACSTLQRIGAELVALAGKLGGLQQKLALVLATIKGPHPNVGPLGEILHVVCDQYRVSAEAVLLGHSRRQRESWARFVAMHLFWRETGWSHMEIAEVFSRDNSTVDYAFRKMSDRMETEPGFREEVSLLEGRLRGGQENRPALKPPKPKNRTGNRQVPGPQSEDHRHVQRPWAFHD